MDAATTSAPANSWGCVHGRARVLDGFIYRHDKARSLRGCSQGIDPHHSWLPHEGLKVVSNVLVVDVYPVPHAPLKDWKKRSGTWNGYGISSGIPSLQKLGTLTLNLLALP